MVEVPRDMGALRSRSKPRLIAVAAALREKSKGKYVGMLNLNPANDVPYANSRTLVAQHCEFTSVAIGHCQNLDVLIVNRLGQCSSGYSERDSYKPCHCVPSYNAMPLRCPRLHIEYGIVCAYIRRR